AGERDVEGRALAGPGLERDLTPEPGDQGPHQGEAEPYAVGPQLGRTSAAPEGLEDVRNLRLGDPGAGVAHGEHDSRLLLVRGGPDAPFARELDRVAQEIDQD